jgi:hypothetical protein
MTKPSMGLVLKTAASEGLRELLRLPLWWYSVGLKETLGKLVGSLRTSVRYFGVDVWSKNLFVPMYGDTSFAGRGISFIVRLTVLAVRSLGVLLWLVVALVLALLYLVILPISIIGFVTHIIGVFL